MNKIVAKEKGTSGIPLSVFSFGSQTGMLLAVEKVKLPVLAYGWSIDGLHFVRDNKDITLHTKTGRKEKVELCRSFSLATIPQGFVLTYIRKSEVGGKTTTQKGVSKKTNSVRVKNYLVTAFSKDLYSWVIKTEEETDSNSAVFLYDKEVDRYLQYRDGLFIKNISSPRFGFWPKKGSLLATSRRGNFDEGTISLIGGEMTDRGVLIMYDASVHDEKKNNTLLQTGLILLDGKNPGKVLWRSDTPIFQSLVEPVGGSVVPIGFVHRKEYLRIYWRSGNEIVVATVGSHFKEIPVPTASILKRSLKNPIIQPRGVFEWEVEGTFNPAAFDDGEGNIHLLYRALGRDGISRVGLASSKDGTHFHKQLPHPVFEPSRGYGMPQSSKVKGPHGYNPAFYTSGGGWGGAEDPRAVVIDGKIYMMYVAFEGWSSVRMALTCLSLEDFKAGRFNWRRPILISPEKQVNKNWLLFPERVNGKFAILHSIVPKISIEYVDSIDEFEKHIESPRLQGPQPGRDGHWDSLLRGAGPPPLKTKEGWLLLYHAIDKKEPGKYKIGAMILDLQDPTKILYRANQPILSPDVWYENDGKPGVVYASGAIIKDGILHVYYGGGDRVVCVATTPLEDILNFIMHGKSSGLALKKINVIN